MGILKFINRHERIKVIWEAVKQNSNEQFRKRVLQTDCLSVSIKEKKNYNKEEHMEGILYDIEMGTWGDGFFAEYKRLLNYLYYADFFGFDPYVRFGKEFTYAEEQPVNGTTNPFEYFFEPIVKEDDIEKYQYYVESRHVDWELANRLKPVNGYEMSEVYICTMAKVSQKYIRWNKATKDYLKCVDQLLEGNKTLAVHVRLTDFKQNFWGHPICVSAEEYLDYVKEAVEKQGFNKIFLATDDKETVELFKKEFPDKLLYYSDVIRSTGNVSVAFSNEKRENHHYKLALEVIRDMYTLSRCQGLIAGKSNVSICAIIENRNATPYEYIKIIDKGQNSGNAAKFANTDIVKEKK